MSQSICQEDTGVYWIDQHSFVTTITIHFKCNGFLNTGADDALLPWAIWAAKVS